MPRSRTSVVATLLRLGVMGKDDWDGALQQILEISCEFVDVDRVSFWSFRDEPSAICCELGYVRHTRLLERGVVLCETAAPDYFAQIRTVQVLDIADIHADPRVQSLGEYCRTHQIRALLDVPVFARGRLAGILCHECVQHPRQWTAHDSELALAMSHTLTGLLEARACNHAEASERRAAFLAQVSNELAQVLDPVRARELAVRRAIPVLGDMATMLTIDGDDLRRVAYAHNDADGQRLMDAIHYTDDGDVNNSGLAARALRERQSLLLPMTDPETLRRFGLPERRVDELSQLRVRSIMAVLLSVGGVATSVLSIASTSRNYDREDLRFAEAYAQQIATLIDNARLYAASQEAVRARDDFLALAGHELRTPLTSLGFAVELLTRAARATATAPVRRAIDTIVRQTTRLSRLTELFSLASRQVDGALPLRFEPLDLAVLVREVVLDFAELLARAGCELNLHTETSVMIRGDHTGLEVVISNLLANAAKFGKGAPIDVRVAREGPSATLVVRDHGIGIPIERLESIFDRYERAVSPHHFGGLGLGLHITWRVVEAHGGKIHADSRPGEGATFTVELPL